MVTYDSRPSGFTQLTTMSDWENLMSALACINAVDASIGGAMVPSMDVGGRNAVLADGVVAIKGQLWRADAPVNTAIPAASAQDRIDRLVVRLTRGATTSPTVVQPVVITGTPSGSPVIPPLTRTSTGIWDLPISHWTSTAAGALSGMVDERITANDPWHDMRPLINSWVGTNATFSPPQYRFSDDCKWVECAGHIKNPTFGVWNTTPFFNLPSAYRPGVQNGERWACTGAPEIDGTVQGFTPAVQAYGDGRVTIEFANGNLPANTVIGINGRFALPVNGFFTS